MGLNICGHQFEGPYDIKTTEIPANRAAIYAILTRDPSGNLTMLDVGESGETGIRLANHDRSLEWLIHGKGKNEVYLLFMPSSAGYTAQHRRDIEKQIRNTYNPPCGVR